MKRVAVGIVVGNGLVLACQRLRNARYPMKWEFPGGKIEQGESAAEALIRELREELSIEVTTHQEFHRQQWVYPDSKNTNNSSGAFHVTYFLVHSFSGEPVNNAFEQIQWVIPADLLTMDILEGNREAIELLVRHAQLQQSATTAAKPGEPS